MIYISYSPKLKKNIGALICFGKKSEENVIKSIVQFSSGQSRSRKNSYNVYSYKELAISPAHSPLVNTSNSNCTNHTYHLLIFILIL